jgi:hypothetical protein
MSAAPHPKITFQVTPRSAFQTPLRVWNKSQSTSLVVLKVICPTTKGDLRGDMCKIRQNKKSETQARTNGLGASAGRSNAPAFDWRVMRGGRMTKSKGEAASFAPNVAHLVSSVARRWSARLLPAALLLALAASSASAADRYWDPNGTAANRGGTGTWDTSSSFWSPNGDGVSGPYGAWSNGALDDAFFGGAAAGTVNLGVPMSSATLPPVSGSRSRAWTRKKWRCQSR